MNGIHKTVCISNKIRKLVHANTDNFFSLKIENFIGKILMFLIFKLKTCIEYPQCMFWTKNKKYRYTPAYPIFVI